MNGYGCACILQVRRQSVYTQTSRKAFQDVLSKNVPSKFKVVFTLMKVYSGLISLVTINRQIQIMIHFSDWLGFNLFEDQLVFQRTNSRVLTLLFHPVALKHSSYMGFCSHSEPCWGERGCCLILRINKR